MDSKTAASAEVNYARSGFFVKSLVVVATLVVSLAMLEVGLRIIGRYPMSGSEGYHEKGGISYVLKKNVSKKVVWPTMSFTVHTSDLGIRSKQPGPRPFGTRPYYAVLGASDAFGNGLDYEKTFIGIFAEKMTSHNIEVLNFAVAGHHLLEQAALFKQFAASASNPPKAVIVVFNPNFIGGYDDIHSNVTVRWGDLYPKDNWRIALIRKILSNSSTVYCFFRDGIRGAQQKFIGREDVALSFWIERFSSRHRIREAGKAEDFLAELEKLEQYIRSLSAQPIFVYCPPAGGFTLNDLASKGKIDSTLFDTKFFTDLIETHCKVAGVRFVNLEPPVQERFNKGGKLNFDADGHFNGPTSQIVGDYLYEVLRPDRKTASD